MQNEYALRACRASASPVFRSNLAGIQKPLTLQIDSCVPMFVSVSHAGAEKRYPTSMAAHLQPGKWCS